MGPEGKKQYIYIYIYICLVSGKQRGLQKSKSNSEEGQWSKYVQIVEELTSWTPKNPFFLPLYLFFWGQRQKTLGEGLCFTRRTLPSKAVPELSRAGGSLPSLSKGPPHPKPPVVGKQKGPAPLLPPILFQMAQPQVKGSASHAASDFFVECFGRPSWVPPACEESEGFQLNPSQKGPQPEKNNKNWIHPPPPPPGPHI